LLAGKSKKAIAMANDKTVSILLNPLAFLEIDEPWASAIKKELTPESVISNLCSFGVGSDIPSLVSRYKEISTEPQRLCAVPGEQRMIKKLALPLKNAKASYTLGNYLGTIALCGMVAEMATLLRYEVSRFAVRGHPITPKEEEALFGRAFEKLDQYRRIQVLHAYGLISEETRSNLDLIREKRRLFLHYYSADESNLAQDAVKVFHAAVSTVVAIIGQDVKDGKLVLDPAIMNYLEKAGLANPAS
jgi:hypothetical protein